MAKKQEDKELKMWLAVRTDIDIPRGKLATQAGHGYANGLIQALADQPELVREYMRGSTPRITVATHNGDSLEKVFRTAKEAGINAYLVMDAGRTVFAEPTLTVCAFGPCLRSELPPYLNRLQLLKDEDPNE